MYVFASSLMLQSRFGAGTPKLRPPGPKATPKLMLSAQVPFEAIAGGMTVAEVPCHQEPWPPVLMALVTLADPPAPPAPPAAVALPPVAVALPPVAVL